MKSIYFLICSLLPICIFAQEKSYSSTTPIFSSLVRQDSLLPKAQDVLPQTEAPKTPTTIGGAFMRSLAIPGWGQRRAGAKTAARNFFVTEVLLWGGFASLEFYGNWLKDDFKLFAATHAGAEISGKDEQFFVDLGNFSSVDEFNQNRLRRRDTEGLYDPATHFWRWDTDPNRQKFFNMRKRSDKAFARAELVAAGVIANHIISGIHAAWLAHRNSSAKEEERGELRTPQLGVITSPTEILFVAQLQL
ncbi:MAG: hypothetical protein ALAOOOJD_02453 [bacterium]|nr:hypothetical protein [bacterium]